MAKTKKPTGISITRKNNNFTVKWKIADKDYGDGQAFQYKIGKSKWTSKNIGKTTTSKSFNVTASRYYPTGSKLTKAVVRIRGNRKKYTSGRKTINPTVSAWSKKEYVFKVPADPVITKTVGTWPQTTFAWKVDTKEENRWLTDVLVESVLVEESDITEGKKVDWTTVIDGATPTYNGTSGTTNYRTTGGATGSIVIVEDSSLLNNGKSYTRWFRVTARGVAGKSQTIYDHHVYALPNAAYITKHDVSPDISASGYNVQVWFNNPMSQARPLAEIITQYAIAVPDPGMQCPDGASWQEGAKSIASDETGGAVFSIDSLLGLDQCLFVRVNTYYDGKPTYGNPVMIDVGKLKKPTGLSVQTGTSVTVTAENTSDVSDSYLVIRFYTANDQNGIDIGIIPSGQTSAIITVPETTGAVAYGVYAVVTDEAPTPVVRDDGVSVYTITPRMKSDIERQGGSVPLAPANVSANRTNIPGTIRVTWDWSWPDADSAELSWSDHPDAWESTDEPETYTITKMYASAWNISGLTTGITWYIRVRLLAGTGDDVTYGAYSETMVIDLASAPAIPILDLSDAVITEDGEVTASWTYVSTDGTAQSAATVAELTYENGEPVYTDLAQVQTAQFVTLQAADYDGWTYGTNHAIVVRVKSESGQMSDDWSAPIYVMIAEPPTCEITSTSLVRRSEKVYAIDYVDPSITSYDIDWDTILDVFGETTADNGDIRITIRAIDALEVTQVGISVTGASAGMRIVNSEDFANYGIAAITIDDTARTGDDMHILFASEYDAYLTQMPFSATISGAGTDGTTTLIIERAETYQMDRPDESGIIGYEGEAVAIWTQTGDAPISITNEDLIGRLDDGARYRLVATVQDNNGQSAEDVTFTIAGNEYSTFTVGWTDQALIPEVQTEIDTENMIAKITPIAPAGASQTATCDIYRLSVDRPELIYEGAAFGTTYVDPFPTIGEYGGHRIVYKTENGDYITAENTLAWYDTDEDDNDILDVKQNIIDFGTGRALVEFNIDLSSKWDKDFEETQYLGGSVQGDWNPAVSRSASVAAVAITDTDQELIQALRRLAVYPGICHVRTKDGSSYPADVQVSESYSVSNGHRISEFDLSITRVDQEEPDGMTFAEWQETQEGE